MAKLWANDLTVVFETWLPFNVNVDLLPSRLIVRVMIGFRDFPGAF